MDTMVARPQMEKVEDLLAQEIEKSRLKREPVSRVTLAKILHQQLGFTVKEAEEMVDRYCEEKNPGVPAYLSNEFGRPYLNILALVNVLLAAGAITFALRFTPAGRPSWPGYILGGVFLILAVLCLYNGVKPAQRRRGRRR